MKNFTEAKKEKGFTLVELIVVIIILGILAAMVMPKLFSNIDEATQKKELAFLNAAEKGYVSVLGEHKGQLYAINGSVSDEIANSLQRSPDTFDYYVGMAVDETDNAVYVFATPDNATDANQVNKLKKMVTGMDESLDNGDGGSAGAFRFDVTCDAGNATNCYYAYYIADGGIQEDGNWMPSDGALDGNGLPQDGDNTVASPTVTHSTELLFNN